MSGIRDVWFSKPRIYASGCRWCCETVGDGRRVVGLGSTPASSFDDMKRFIVLLYKRIGNSVEWAA